MSRLCQRKFTFTAVLSLSMLVLVPMGYGATALHGSQATATAAVAATGPTLPPLPWCGIADVPPVTATGPTLPPLPWCGIV
jgi:hypothetical protein